MSREININRQLLGLEDILFGTGIVTQIRAGQTVNITRINAGNLPFDETQSLLQWAQSVNVEALGSMITELQAIYDNLASISNVDDNLSLLNNIISNITVLQELHTNLSILQNVNSNITIITEVNTNLDILTSIYNNLSALVNIHTNLTSLLAIDTNMQQLLAIDTNLPELLSINTNIVPNITEILDVNNKAEQVALDKQVVGSLASQVTMDKQDINTMKLAVETIYDTFDDRFLGAKDIDPLVDNDGNALLDGALYFNTLSNALKVYVLDITTWVTIPQIYLSSLLDVQLTSITTNSILTWNGAKWVNTTTPVFDSIKLTGTNYGVMSWNTDEQVPSITLNSDVDIDLGESLILVKNTTGSTILDGRVVMAIGSNGNSGNILVSLHSGLKADAKRTIGIATQNILNNSMGFVTKEGKVKGINTTGSIYGETWVDGDILYVKANGALTKVEPLDSQLKMPIAFVIHAHTHGTLYIRTTGIDENHDRDFINNLVDIHSKTAKTTLADADEFMTADSTSTFSLKKITWASIKTLLANLFIPKVTSTDNAIVRFNGTTGYVQNSGVIIDDNNNVGIGTGSPDFPLEVVGNGTTVKISNNNIEPATTALQIGGYSGNSLGIYGAILRSIHNFGVTASSSLAFELAGTERMRIDSSGNFGIGVTPSAWESGYTRAIEIGTAQDNGTIWSSLQQQHSHIGIGANFYMDSSFIPKYKASYAASQYKQEVGRHHWQTAPSGIAGNAITWNTAMTLDADGRLGVGTTSPQSSLHITKASLSSIGAELRLHNNYDSNATGHATNIVLKTGVATTDGKQWNIGTVSTSTYGGNPVLLFKVAAQDATTPVEQMRIDFNGNLLLTSGTGALGYGTGAGGTVTQLTSKSTAVTLNKPSGLVTMHNSALAAGESVTFLIANSLFNVLTDLCLITPFYRITDPTRYRIECIGNGGGSTIAVKVTNITGSSLSQEVEFRFVIIKGANS